eukprot:11890193-Alexandrium_andersonii.AAC.1
MPPCAKQTCAAHGCVLLASAVVGHPLVRLPAHVGAVRRVVVELGRADRAPRERAAVHGLQEFQQGWHLSTAGSRGCAHASCP